MSNKEDFDALRGVIEEFDEADRKYPTIPMGTYLQEAEDLFVWASMDRDMLLQAGLDRQAVDGLPVRIGAARHAQSLWNSVRFTQKDAQKEYARLSPDAYDLRNTMVHHMLFAYRNETGLRGRIQAIAEGNGDSDMIQDLSDIAVLGKANPAPLTAINVDLALLDRCAEKAASLGELLAISRGETVLQIETKALRDSAYTLLKRSMDDIREFGRYVFWRTPERAAGYASAYLRRNRARSSTGAPETTTAPSPETLSDPSA